MNNKKFFAVLAGVVLFQIVVLSVSITSTNRFRNKAEKDGRILTVDVDFNDPYDPIRGRYVYLRIIFNDELEAECKRLGIEKPDFSKVRNYYTQENYALFADEINWKTVQTELKPKLSLYVNEDGYFLQKSLTVMDGENRIPFENYCKKYAGKSKLVAPCAVYHFLAYSVP